MQTKSVACGAATPEEFVRETDYFSRNLEAVGTDMTPEGIVVEEVVRYFSGPRFQKFSIEKEYPIQMGSVNRRADVVLVDSADNLVAIAECKRVGVEGQGLDQLKSYLSAKDTRFGIFANSTYPAAWDFYENLGGNRVRRMTRSEFEERAVNRENNRAQPDPQSVRSGSAKHFVNKGGTMEKSLTIRPTLYIGLGTTGTEILDNLRERNFQEYGRAGLPIFRYVSIETDQGNTGKFSSIDAADRVEFDLPDEDSVPRILRQDLVPPSYERNRVIHTTISDRETIRGQIDPSNDLIFNEHLADWLDEKVLDSAAVKFGGGGAGNIRMAGRLALWENWSKDGKSVKPILRTAYHDIQEPASRNDARGFLKRHFGREIKVDPKTHNVFIVGTLCGGTCSGMLLDIAYYFRRIGNADTKIYGLFTMYNEDLALGGDPGILLANCYASLIELDFYNRRETAYEITLPDGTSIYERREPFNVASFFSPTTMEGWSCTTEGHFDLDQLNRMVSTDLFVRSLGVETLIEADLVNAPARDSRFGKVRNVGDTPGKNAFVQYMFSSGVTDVWLPKERIVKGAVGEFISELQRKWEHQPAPDSRKAAALVPTEIVGDIEVALLKPDEDSEAFDTRLQEDLEPINAADNQDQARNRAIDSLIHLVPRAGGKYYLEFDEKSTTYCGQYRAKLKEAAESFEGCSQLFPKQQFLNAVHGLIQSKLEDLEDDWSEGLVDRMADEIRKIVEEAVADNTNVVPKKGFFGSERSEFNLERFKGRMADEQIKLRKKFVTFFVGKTLRGIQRDIAELRGEVDEDIKHIQAKFTQSRLSAGNPHSSIKSAAEALSALAPRSDELSSLESLEYFLRYIRDEEPDSFCFLIRGKLREPFDRWASTLISDAQFGNEAGRRSSPYQEFVPDYGNYRLSLGEPGGDARMFRYLVAAADDSNLRDEAQAKFEEAFIPNLRVLYQMEAGYTLDDISVASFLRDAYESALSEYRMHDGYPVHIHQDPDRFGEEAIRRAIRESQEAREINRRFEEVQRDAKALQELWKYAVEENGNSFQYVSSNGSGDLTIEVRGEHGFLRAFNVADESGLRDLAGDSVASAEFQNQTRAEFRIMYEAGTLVRCIDRFHKENVVNRKESEKFYMEYTALVRKQRASD